MIFLQENILLPFIEYKSQIYFLLIVLAYLHEYQKSMIVYDIRPATTALAEIVIIQAKTIRFPKPQRTDDNLVLGPTPTIAPDIE